jgi:hypothetical protein
VLDQVQALEASQPAKHVEDWAEASKTCLIHHFGSHSLSLSFSADCDPDSAQRMRSQHGAEDLSTSVACQVSVQS